MIIGSYFIHAAPSEDKEYFLTSIRLLKPLFDHICCVYANFGTAELMESKFSHYTEWTSQSEVCYLSPTSFPCLQAKGIIIKLIHRFRIPPSFHLWSYLFVYCMTWRQATFYRFSHIKERKLYIYIYIYIFIYKII